MERTKYKILLIDDEQSQIDYLKRYIESSSYLGKWIEIPIKTAWANPNAIHIANKIKEEYLEYDVILSDLYMPYPQDGGLKIIETLEECHKKDPDGAPKLIVISNKPDAEEKVSDYNAKYSSWFRFYQKPTEPEKYGPTYQEGENWAVALSYAILTLNNPYEFSIPQVAEDIIGCSQEIKNVIDIAMKAASTSSNVLLLGESGTGKELIARAVHYNSSRKDGPFVVINCGALPENLQESELFGHVKGAFTGAIKDKMGLFQQAQKGTVLLDEIGETLPSTQVKLLRFLEDGEIRPVGGNKSILVDTRIIAATNKNLEAAMKSGALREDLFYRICVISIKLPALRERKEDILPLVNHFLEYFSTKFKKPRKKLTSEAEQILISYSWPGNVRELKNAIERAVTLTDFTFNCLRCPANIVSTIITKQDITDTDIIANAVRYTAGHWDNAARELGLEYEEFTTRLRNAILKILLAEDNKTRVMAIIGISRQPFYKVWRRKLDLW